MVGDQLAIMLIKDKDNLVGPFDNFLTTQRKFLSPELSSLKHALSNKSFLIQPIKKLSGVAKESAREQPSHTRISHTNTKKPENSLVLSITKQGVTGDDSYFH